MLTLPAVALGIPLVAAAAAHAAAFSITTSGIITSGSDPANLLGAGTDLAGDPYTLTLAYDGLGPSYYTDGSGGFATDLGDSITGAITVTVAGHALATSLLANTGPSLTEDRSDIIDTNSGNDAAGDFAYGSQDVGSSTDFIPYADLQTAFSYVLAPGDTGLDSYSFSNAADTESVSFSGAAASVVFQVVPEPASWALIAAGVLGLGIIGRRRA